MTFAHDVPGDRITRRLVLNQEYAERKHGQWSPWEFVETPGGLPSADPAGWLRDVERVARNGWCAVLIRACRTAWGIVDHAAIRNATQTDFTWAERQRIKDEVFGPDRVALEVFPSRDRLIDAANMYHLWVMPPDWHLPFGLSSKDLCSGQHYRRS